MRSRRDLAAWLLALSIVVSCTAQPAEPAAVWSSLAERPCPDGSGLRWESFGGPFFFSWCTGCHSIDLAEGLRQGAPLGVDFDDLERIRKHADAIWARAADHNATMPPVGSPSQSERAQLGEWLACGAPADAEPPPYVSEGAGGAGTVASCDVGNDCQACIQCVSEGVCANDIEACASDPECSDAIACFDQCQMMGAGGAGPEGIAACIEDCVMSNPDGFAALNTANDCKLTNCPNACAE